MEFTPHSRGMPSPRDWGMALLSLLLTGTLIASSGLVLRGIQRAIARQEIVSHVENGDSKGAHEALDVQARGVAGIIAPQLISTNVERQSLRFAHGLVDLLVILDSGDAQRGSSYLEGLVASVEIPKVLDLTKLRETLAQGSAIERDLDPAKQRIGLADAELASLLPRFRAIEGEFLNFLGLTQDEREASPTPQFYQSGVLQGLPLLSVLPDGISDLPALRFLLQQRGGRVNITPGTVDPHEAFKERLTGLKDKSSAIKDAAENFTQYKLLAQKEIEEIRGKSARVRKLASQLVMDLIRSLVSEG